MADQPTVVTGNFAQKLFKTTFAVNNYSNKYIKIVGCDPNKTVELWKNVGGNIGGGMDGGNVGFAYGQGKTFAKRLCLKRW